MTNDTYLEKEIKILNIDVTMVTSTLEKLGATKVFDGKRIRTTFNSATNLLSNGIELRVTEEDEIKLSLDEKTSSGEISSIKLKISRAKEMEDLLAKLGIYPISKVESQRISYELDNVDFDIDQFPSIPPFMEIDLEHFRGDVKELLEKLNLKQNEIFIGSTIELFRKYNKDYVNLFAISY